MKYTDWLIPQLRDYEARKQFLADAPDRLRELEERSTAIRAAKTDGIPTHDGVSPYEDAIIANLAEREKIAANVKMVSEDIARLDSALEQLSAQERLVIQRFYIHRTSDYIERLSDELCLERSQVYRVKDHAVIHLARILFGIVEL